MDPGPYWLTKQPWKVSKETLVDNKPTVVRVMNSTKAKLNRKPDWRAVYGKQLKDLLERGFTREFPKEELQVWIQKGGKTYYIAYQLALNLTFMTKPVRVIFNSFQKYKGPSLNSSWSLGPDVMNSLHGVLMKFRRNYVGAQRDVTKMFYMVWITKEEQFCQLFLWQFPEDSQVRTFCMTRLVMGNIGSTNLSIVAMKKTADLGDNRTKYPIAFDTISRKTYVDNVLIDPPNHVKLKKDIEEIELVSAMGGFYYKEWTISSQDVPEQFISVQLPNQIGVD